MSGLEEHEREGDKFRLARDTGGLFQTGPARLACTRLLARIRRSAKWRKAAQWDLG